MTRIPQPMRRMRYLIGEALRQDLIPEHLLASTVRGDSWLAGEGVIPERAFRFTISPLNGVWLMMLDQVENGVVPIIRATLLTDPGAEKACIGPEDKMITIKPRTTPARETIRASILAD